MSRTGGNVASLVALMLQNEMAGTTYKRSQGTMVHVVLTSPEIHSKYISWHTLRIISFVTTLCWSVRVSLSGKTTFSFEGYKSYPLHWMYENIPLVEIECWEEQYYNAKFNPLRDSSLGLTVGKIYFYYFSLVPFYVIASFLFIFSNSKVLAANVLRTDCSLINNSLNISILVLQERFV